MSAELMGDDRPCAVCLYGAAMSGSDREADPAVTSVRGTLVCEAHVIHGFDVDDGSGTFARFIDRAYDAGNRDTGAGQCGRSTPRSTFCCKPFGHRGACD